MNELVAIITGGAGALAGAIAQSVRDRGLQVHAPEKTELDVTDVESVRAFFARFDQVNLLINNAGVRADALCVKMSEAEWDQVLAVNLRGAFLCSQAVSMKMMRQRSGHIINVGSFAAKFGSVGQANYAAAKAGLIALTQSLAKEMGKRGVRVNCVLPGFLETKFSDGMPEKAKKEILEAHELGQFNTVTDAARFIAFLETMSFVSGQVFQLDSRVAPWT
jgi:NAD(P)-dependent dehydrogenase (short-subunit alcohol dehydrogenase family)